MEQETQKIRELDEQSSNELREWKLQLVPRKQVSLTFSWLCVINSSHTHKWALLLQ